MIDWVFGVLGVLVVVAYVAFAVADSVLRRQRRATADRLHAAAIAHAAAHGLPPVPPRNGWRY